MHIFAHTGTLVRRKPSATSLVIDVVGDTLQIDAGSKKQYATTVQKMVTLPMLVEVIRTTRSLRLYKQLQINTWTTLKRKMMKMCTRYSESKVRERQG